MTDGCCPEEAVHAVPHGYLDRLYGDDVAYTWLGEHGDFKYPFYPEVNSRWVTSDLGGWVTYDRGVGHP